MKSHSALFVVPVVIALAGVAGILVATPHGIGLTPDSIGYVGGARNIIDGKGLTMPSSDEPVTHHAPLYPVLLAAVALIGPEPAQGARWLAAAFFGLNLILVWGVASQTRAGVASASAWVPAGITLLVLVAPTMWEIHLMAWSEPVYISLCLAGLGLTAAYLGDPNPTWLVAAATSIGLATVTRYAGLSMVASCCLALLLLERQSIARRVADAAGFAMLGMGPFVLWTGRNLLLAGTATSRSIVIHPIDKGHLSEALGTASSWLQVPEHAPGWEKAAALVAVGSVLVVGIWLQLKASGERTTHQGVRAIPDIVKVTFVAAVVYPLFLALSISLADANTPLDQRILSPLFVLLVILGAFGLQSWIAVAGRRKLGRLLAVVPVCLVFVAYCGSSYPLIARSFREGLGFNDQRWTRSSLVRALERLPQGTTIYSNSPEAVYYHAGRGATRLPMPFSRVTRSASPTYAQELTAMSRSMDTGGVLVYFDLGPFPTGHVEALIHDLGLVPLGDYPDGRIYGSPDRHPAPMGQPAAGRSP